MRLCHALSNVCFVDDYRYLQSDMSFIRPLPTHGPSTKSIASTLDQCESTVRTYLRPPFEKLGIAQVGVALVIRQRITE